jgi:hypothetical protein
MKDEDSVDVDEAVRVAVGEALESAAKVADELRLHPVTHCASVESVLEVVAGRIRALKRPTCVFCGTVVEHSKEECFEVLYALVESLRGNERDTWAAARSEALEEAEGAVLAHQGSIVTAYGMGEVIRSLKTKKKTADEVAAEVIRSLKTSSGNPATLAPIEDRAWTRGRHFGLEEAATAVLSLQRAGCYTALDLAEHIRSFKAKP